MDWDDVRHFLALARTGSVRAAGKSLGVSHSTVARRVEGLESRLTARLFARNRDGYTLTAAGREMLARAEGIEREMDALERELIGQDERLEGAVSITCCDDWIGGLLLGGLEPFLAEHAGIELHLDVDSRSFDLSKREADVAIRATGRGDTPPEHLLGARVMPIHLASYVGADHVQRLDPRGPAARWLAFDDSRVQQAMVSTSSFPELPVWGRFSSLQQMVNAGRLGVGLVMLPVYIGDQEPELVRLPGDALRHMGELWMLSHADLRDNARFRAVRAQIRAVFDAHAPLFRGECPSDAPERPAHAPNALDDQAVG